MEKEYLELIMNLKQSIVQSRYTAARLVNKEQLKLYYKIGGILSAKVNLENWGTKVLERIAIDLQTQLPGLRGFSFRNLKNMRQFYETYRKIGQKMSALIEGNAPEAFWSISFSHHILLLNKCKELEEKLFYIKLASERGWSLQLLEHNIAGNLYEHRGKLSNNFATTLPTDLKKNALDIFQDQYLFDFLSFAEEDERVFEAQIVANIKNMIMTLGKGFSFIGNQYRLEVEEEEFFVDLLFFNRHLRCLVAFELKRGKFKPEYAGKLNFYLNVLDEKVRLGHENPSIGIILCKEKKNTVVEFAVRSIDKAMGVATYRTTKEVPTEMRGILPNVAEMVKLL